MKRQYGLVGDKTVVEEREVVLTERRYIWGNEVKTEPIMTSKDGETDVKITAKEDTKMEE
jgi:hypothetical protein